MENNFFDIVDNMILFIQALAEKNWGRLESLSLILALFYLCVLVAILIDLISGIEKAKRKGLLRTSYGFRRTINKIKDYYSVLMLFTLADIIASIWFTMPFFTAIGAIGIVLIEARSVYENKKDINKGIKDLPFILSQVIKNKDDVKELIKFLNDNTQSITTDIPTGDTSECK